MTDLGIYESGDTIQPVVTFHDWAPVGDVGVLIDPATVTVTTFDSENNILDNLTPVHESLGIYHADWILPENNGKYFIEFNGTISGEPAIKRGFVKVKFVV